MLEKVSQIAKQAATNVSRRGFLGRIGRGAGMTAAAMGAALALPAMARAGRKTRICATESQIGECAGKPVGSPCFYNEEEGRCAAVKVDGVYYCNECRSKGGGRGPKRPRR